MVCDQKILSLDPENLLYIMCDTQPNHVSRVSSIKQPICIKKWGRRTERHANGRQEQ